MARLLAQWNHKAGVEFTRIHKTDCEFDPHVFDLNGNPSSESVIEDDDYCTCDDCLADRNERIERNKNASGLPTVMDSVRNIINGDESLKSLTWCVGTDPGCLEIPSAPLMSWTKLKKFYMQIDKICANHNYTANDNAVGTGGHIHVEHGGDKLLQLKVLRDNYYRPYVMYAFSNPQDDNNCASLSRGRFPKAYEDEWQKENYNRSVIHIDYISGAINLQDETLEFRLFDMSWNWQEQEEHMAYVQAYMSWIKSKNYVAPVAMKWTHESVIPVKWMIAEFRKHIIEIGLPWKRYAKYVGYIEGRYKWKNHYPINAYAMMPHSQACKELDSPELIALLKRS